MKSNRKKGIKNFFDYFFSNYIHKLKFCYKGACRHRLIIVKDHYRLILEPFHAVSRFTDKSKPIPTKIVNGIVENEVERNLDSRPRGR